MIGFIIGLLLIGLIGLVLNFVLSDDQRKMYFGESKTYPMVTYTADLMAALMPDKSVLKHHAKEAEKKAVQAVTGGQGRGPLEPGQKDLAKKPVDDNGYSAIERKALNSLIPAATQQQPAPRTYNK